MSAWLRQLVAEATPAPWDTGPVTESMCIYAPALGAKGALAWTSTQRFRNGVENARLIALAPRLALLCADMAELIRSEYGISEEPEDGYDPEGMNDWPNSLLARLDALRPKDAA